MMPAKQKTFFVVSLIYIAYTIFPLFADVFHIPVWLPSLVAFGVMLALYPKAFFNRTFYWFLAYAFVLIICLLLGRRLTIGIGSIANSKKLLVEFAWMLPPISIFCILQYINDRELNGRLAKWSVVLLFASFLVVIPMLKQYASVRSALYEEEYGESIRIVGMPGYALMHAWTLMVPFLCYAIKINKGKKKWFALLGLVILCFMIYDTFVATSLFLTIGVLLFSLFYSDKNRDVSTLVFALLLFVLFILYKTGVFVILLEKIMIFYDGTPVFGKLRDMRESLIQGKMTGGTITGRQDYHEISWHSFFRHPILGGQIVGGHSSMLDRLGGMGLVAFIPFLMIFVSAFKQISKQLQNMTTRMYYVITALLSLVFLYNKGVWGGEGWLMYLVLVPLFLKVEEDKYLTNSNYGE